MKPEEKDIIPVEIDLPAVLDEHKDEAEELLKDKDKLEEFLEQVEEKLKKLGKAGEMLANVPVMISLVRDYVKGDFKEFPLNSLIAVIAALIYVVNPFDIVPDQIPLIGQLDDAAVVALVFKMMETDIKRYKEWKEEQGK